MLRIPSPLPDDLEDLVTQTIGCCIQVHRVLRPGLDVSVYEQSARLGELGAGIQISPNGTRILYALGLEEALLRIQVNPLRKEIRHWSTGETWNWYDLGATTTERYGTPHLLLHRADMPESTPRHPRLKPDASILQTVRRRHSN
jgi:salicylate hydroxylase